MLNRKFMLTFIYHSIFKYIVQMNIMVSMLNVICKIQILKSLYWAVKVWLDLDTLERLPSRGREDLLQSLESTHQLGSTST